jgi:predicted XRE-type DNA-binding protein
LAPSEKYEVFVQVLTQQATQREAAEILGIDQPKVSALVRGHLKGFSMERLYRFLNALGKDVEIVIRARDAAGVRVRTPGRRRSVAKGSRTRTTQQNP